MGLKHSRVNRIPKKCKAADSELRPRQAYQGRPSFHFCCKPNRPPGLSGSQELWKPQGLLPSSLTCYQHKTSLCGERPQRRRLGRLLRKGLLLTVPLLARCVGHSSGDVLISPELAA